MRIGVLGTGMVGGALGVGWARCGHDVVWGAREPGDGKHAALVARAGGAARVATVAEAAAGAEVVTLAVPWPAVRATLTVCGDLAGTVLLDCTNPLRPDLSGLELGFDVSGGEQVAAWAPRARVVKAFNTVGVRVMEDPLVAGHRATLLYCGDDEDARQVAAELGRDLGFEPVDAGGLVQARLLEPLAMLWISLAFGQRLGPDFAFTLIRR
jgi:hypothetical protein